jgi:hypothetical protein
LRKVIEWCEHHRTDPPPSNDEENDNRKKTTEIDEWDQKFMQVDQEMLFEIILVCDNVFSIPFPISVADYPTRHPTTSTLNPSSMSAARPLPT